MKILGIESSCDETAVAVVEDGRRVLASEISSQIPIHTLYGGVVPEIASRAHLEAISNLTDRVLAVCPDYDAIAVTAYPGLIGALLVGVGFAKGLAYATQKPLIPVHHLRGHVAAAYLCHETLEPPFTAMVVSGGHTMILDVPDYTTFSILGGTRDDAAGEAFDKVARVIGLGYPGGPKVQKAAETGNPDAIPFPKVHFKENPYDFSFSGVKTAVINYVHNAEQKGEAIPKADVAASFSKAVCEILTEKALLAATAQGHGKLVLAGGVAANATLRAMLENACNQHKISLYLPTLAMCGDNAAMIAAQGYYEALAGHYATLDLNAEAVRPISVG